MKVLALNSSLRQDGESRTELMLNHLVKGMREAGADVEVLNMRDKTIHYCMGCFSCDTITPGQCRIQDDMAQELFLSGWPPTCASTPHLSSTGL